MKRKPSPAVAISLVALFFSLGGVGVAATGYRINSIWQISPKVRHALRGHRGHQGIPGQQGPQGAQGPAGQSATISQPFFYVRHSGPDTLNASTHPTTTLDVFCDPSDRALTGGYDGQNEIVTADEPLSGSTVTPWVVSAHLEQGAASGTVTGWVLCERT